MGSKILKISLVLSLFMLPSPISAQTTSTFYNELDSFYKTYVSSGKVDYKALLQNRTSLNSMVELTEKVRVSENDRLDYQAFWINAYNVHTIKAIVDVYPIASPLDKAGFFDKATHNIAGKKITLNDIENTLLRAKFNDARVHFVLVCGAMGCPPLITSAYRPELLETQLTQQTKLAINNKEFTRTGNNTVELSQIFEWYKSDFEQNGASVIDFLNAYLTTPLTEKTKIKFYSYNWKLNSK